MNARNRKPITDLSTCPRCGMDSGERKESVNVPLRYYVRCGGFGYTVSGDSQEVERHEREVPPCRRVM